MAPIRYEGSRPSRVVIELGRSRRFRLPEKLADAAEVVARGRGSSVNALVVEALEAEIARVRADKGFMQELRALTERDKEIVDRLAE